MGKGKPARSGKPAKSTADEPDEELIRRIGRSIAAQNDSDDEDMSKYFGGAGMDDDEDIDEDAAFDAEDERKWGEVVNPIVTRVGSSKLGVAEMAGRKRERDAGTPRGAAKSAVEAEADARRKRRRVEPESESDAEEEEDEDDEEDDDFEGGGGDDDSEASDDVEVDFLDVLEMQLQKQQKSKPAAKGSKKTAAIDHDDSDGGEELTAEQHEALLKLLGAEAAAGQGETASAAAAPSGRRAGKDARVRLAEEVATGAGSSAARPDDEYGATGAAATSRKSAKAAGVAAGAVDLSALLAGLGKRGAAAMQADEDDAVVAEGALKGLKVGVLKKQLKRLLEADEAAAKGSKKGAGIGPLAAPPSRVVLERAERAEAYKAANDAVSKWTTLVQINRRAPHLSFSAEATTAAGGILRVTTSSLARSFAPTNEFEAAVAGALEGAGMGALPGRTLAGAGGAQGDAAVAGLESAELQRAAAEAVMADDLPTAELSAEQVRARQAELSKLRALMFYEEQRARRQNKIKSKAYRRLKNRIDTKMGKKEREELRALDPEAAAKLDEEEARLLVKERMDLKHRAGKGIGGSKWIKRVLARQGGDKAADPETKEALLGHLRRADALRQRMLDAKERAGADNSSDEDSDDDSGSEGDEEGGQAEDTPRTRAERAAADLAKARRKLLQQAGLLEGGEAGEAGAAAEDAPERFKGILGMKFMQAAADRRREEAKQEALALAQRMAADEAKLRARIASGELDARPSDWNDGVSVPSEDDSDAEGGRGLMSDLEDSDDEGKGRGKGATAAAAAGAAAGSGRAKFAGASGAGGAKGSRGKAAAPEDAAAVEAALGGVGGAAVRVRSGGSKAAATAEAAAKGAPAAAASESAPAASNPWLTQGGVTYTGGSAATAAAEAAAARAAAEAAKAANPWLASAFDSSAAGGTATGIGRNTATKRALAEKAGEGGSNGVMLDVAGSLARLAAPAAAAPAATSGAVTADFTGSLKADTRVIKGESGKPGAAPAPAAEASKSGKKGGKAGGALSAAEQEELIRRAFAGAGAEETAAELAAARQEDQADVEAAVAAAEGAVSGATRRKALAAGLAVDSQGRPMDVRAGWGTWAGLGTLSADEQRKQELAAEAARAKRLAKAGRPPPPPSRTAVAAALLADELKRKAEAAAARAAGRADAKLSNVIISEKRDKKLAKHQADVVPYPFTSREQYEASLRAPVGKEWNTLTATSAATQPEVVTRAGVIINPIAFVDVKKAHKEAMAAAASEGGSKKKGGAGGGFQAMTSLSAVATAGRGKSATKRR